MKKIVIIVSLIIVLIIGLILTLKKESKEENIKPKELLIQNEKIEIINDEVFIEATLTNKNKENIKLDNVDIILLNQNKEVLKIKYYVRYQDDFLLFHPSKDYLKYCLQEIEKFLTKEKLTLNIKTRIYKSTNNFLFLGRDKNGKYARYRNVKRKLKNKYYLYKKDLISLGSFICSLRCYQTLCNRNNLFKLKDKEISEDK